MQLTPRPDAAETHSPRRTRSRHHSAFPTLDPHYDDLGPHPQPPDPQHRHHPDMGVQVPALVTAEAGYERTVQHGQQQLCSRLPREQVRALGHSCHFLAAGHQHGAELCVLGCRQVCCKAAEEKRRC